jgi:F-type H+-transporting ATPase subunit b
MSIDWFTVAAQIVNFLILVALLHWFLYQPIVRAMAKRDEMLAARQDQADEQLAEGKRLAEHYANELQRLEFDREQKLRVAREEVDQYRSRLLAESREELQQRRHEWIGSFQRERSDLLLRFKQETGKAAVDVAHRILKQLADQSLEERVIDVFRRQLTHLDGPPRDVIDAALRNGTDTISVRTAFPTTEPMRLQIRDIVAQVLGVNLPLTFEHDAELICGVELEVGGYSLGWSVQDYLKSIESRFDHQLRQPAENVVR